MINLTLYLPVKLGNTFNPFAPSEMMVKFPALNKDDKFNPFLPVEKIGITFNPFPTCIILMTNLTLSILVKLWYYF